MSFLNQKKGIKIHLHVCGVEHKTTACGEMCRARPFGGMSTHVKSDAALIRVV